MNGASVSFAHEQAFRLHASQRNLAAAKLCSLLAAILMPAGLTLDLATNPDRSVSFFLLRIAATAGVLAVLALSRHPAAPKHTYGLGLAPVVICALSIQLMIESLGGFASSYYAGLNLCLLAIGILYTWSLKEAALACLLVVSIWLIPSLFRSPLDDFANFFNNLYFLILTSVVAIAANTSRYRQTRREFDATSELARTSAQLESALEQLQELNRQKTEFFTNISHELRTPLTLILTPVEARLGNGDLEGAELNFFEIIRRNAYRLLRLIDDLLDHARIDAGRFRLRVTTVDLGLLVRHSLAAFQPAATSRGIRLEVQGPESIEGLHGDSHRLEIVLTNLLSNALKFTPDGGSILLDLQVGADEVRLSVTDSGPGISPQDQLRVFDRFFRAEDSEQRSHGGAGIGLSLAKELIELHGGSLSVSSGPELGATFTIRLPLGRAHFRPEILERRKVQLDVTRRRRASDLQLITKEAEPAIPEPATEVDEEPIHLEKGRKPRIAVVEDNDEIRALIVGLLTPAFEVSTASDGREGLSLVREEHPDLVISDVMMPRMSGTELCVAIKADPKLQSTPVILLTARSGPEAAIEGYAHGADDFVAKPIHPRVMVARVRAQLRLRAMGLQLASQARLAAVGTLAAGIGHEVRNPVNAVINGARTLLERHQLEPSARKVLEIIEDAGTRIDEISYALLDHAQPAEEDRPRPCDVRVGLDATLRLLQHRSAGVKVHREYASNRSVVGSAAQLNQVFMNLLDNAIRSSAENVWVGVHDDDERLSISIEDDGPGVPREMVQRIFDPFFTTREPGVGTGLGLYLSNQIVLKHGGNLLHAERPGGGAIFKVELPAQEPT